VPVAIKGKGAPEREKILRYMRSILGRVCNGEENTVVRVPRKRRPRVLKGKKKNPYTAERKGKRYSKSRVSRCQTGREKVSFGGTKNYWRETTNSSGSVNLRFSGGCGGE